MSSDDESKPKEASERGLALTRSRRPVRDKYGRKAVLERLKNAKKTGERVKYEVKDVEDVYDIVDEDEYSERRNQRLEDDWIEDDGTGMYVDDGTEIFDDETAENLAAQRKETASSKRAAQAKRKSLARNTIKTSDIRHMFGSSSSKPKKTKQANLEKDDDLMNILDQLGGDDVTPDDNVASTSHHSDIIPLHQVSSATLKPKKLKPAASSRCSVEAVPVKRDASPSQIISKFVDVEPFRPPPKKMKVEEKFCDMDDDMDLEAINFDDPLDDCDGDAEPKLEHVPQIKVEPVKKKELSYASLGWSDVKPEPNVNNPVFIDQSSLETILDDEGNQVFRFYWLDAHEDQYTKPGVVYLFGKVWHDKANRYVSCCVVVSNIERTVYFLPKENDEVDDDKVLLGQVWKEFDTKVSSKFGIMKYKSKMVGKLNVFGAADVPREANYLEVVYPAQYGVLPAELTGETFSHVFGCNQSPLESLLLNRKIKGPCWLDIKKCVAKSASGYVSHCKLELGVTSADDVTVSTCNKPPPPVVVMSLSLKTIPNLTTHQNEIIGIAGLVHNSFPVNKPASKPYYQQSFFAISKPKDRAFPFDFNKEAAEKRNFNVDILMNEKVLLNSFLAKVAKFDPDVIVGHNLIDFGLDVMLHRLHSCKVATWSKLGRLKRQNMPKLFKGGKSLDRTVTSGRILCDLKISAKELIRCKSYDLSALVKHVLDSERQEIPAEHLKDMFTSSQKLFHMVEHTLVDARFVLDIACELQALPLALQITNIAGNVLSRTLLGGRSERNEFLLLHAFHARNYLPPDKKFKKKEKPTADESGAVKSGKARKKAAYEGGLVLEPKKGFYDKYILLLDFNSLYPSIIQEYNICFTTMSRHDDENDQEENHVPELPEDGLESGVLPTEIRQLVERRREVKKLMKNQGLSPDEYKQLDIRQKALKLTANSMYGCLGFGNSRFYAKSLAALITRQGREILMSTKELAEKMSLEVIYGDTDSIMINTNSVDMEEAFKLGNKVKAEVNKLYKLLEIDIDGVYKSLLLLKKKKYAAISVQKLADGGYKQSQELKGLDIVRRDWCELAKDAGNYAVSQILSAQPQDIIVERIHENLEEIGRKVKEGSFPDEKFIIRKELTREPESYPGKDNLPHVRVAIRTNKNMTKRLRSGDIVSYVICQDGTSNAATQRSYSIEELNSNDNLKLDENYYLAQQVHPVVTRLCDPIDGTDPSLIAQCLGLDGSSFKKRIRNEDEEERERLSMHMSEEERFASCKPFTFTADEKEGGEKFEFKLGVFAETDPTWVCTLAQPCGKGKVLADHMVRLQNQLSLAIRQHIKKYYEGWLICSDPACSYRTRSVPIMMDWSGTVCSACYHAVMQVEYSYRNLYQQLSFYKLQFDVEYALKKYKQDSTNSRGVMKVEAYRRHYKQLSDLVDFYLSQSGYNRVSFPTLFPWMKTDQQQQKLAAPAS